MKRHFYQNLSRQRYRQGSTFVGIYSNCELTQTTKDKLFAVSGLARKIGPSSEYLAGLWRPILLHQLLWMGTGSSSRQKEWRAPTWSWASIDGQVTLGTEKEPIFDTFYPIICEVLDATVTLASLDPFGPVSSGVLTLRAPLLPMTLHQYHGRLSWIGDMICADICPDFEAADILTDGATLICMPVMLCEEPGEAGTIGILLEPTGEEPGKYYRYGVLRNRDKGENEIRGQKSWESFKASPVLEGYGPYLGKHEYTKWHQYQVTLV
jgi:hypothetical protein